VAKLLESLERILVKNNDEEIAAMCHQFQIGFREKLTCFEYRASQRNPGVRMGKRSRRNFQLDLIPTATCVISLDIRVIIKPMLSSFI
jgi:hypothetical protein